MKHWLGGVGELAAAGLVLSAAAVAAAEPGATAALAAGASAAPASAPAPPQLRPYHFEPGVVCPLCAITPQFPEGRSGLHWHAHWRSAGTPEFISIGLLGATALGLGLFVDPPREARWDSALPLDEALRDALRIDSARGRARASTVSDVLFVWEVLHPSLIDPLLVAWWQRESPFVAWQMLVIDAQAYALTLTLNDLAKTAFARARPWARNGDCAEDPESADCGSGGRNVSFYSGHAAVTATGAGLLCAHHTQLSLHQSDLLDGGTCVLAVLGTALTGALRIASDNHWASDVIVGHLMGYASGYLLPTLLYYKEFRTTPHNDAPPPVQYSALPLVRDGALGVSLVGWF